MDFRSHEQLALALDADDALEAFSGFAFDTCSPAVAVCASLSDSDTTSLCSLFSHASDSDGASPASPAPPRLSDEQPPQPQPPQSFDERSSGISQLAIKNLRTAAPANGPAKTKAPRKHNRIEILKLRDEMEALLSQLETLKRAKDGRSSPGSSQQSGSSGAARTLAVRTVSAAVASQFALRGMSKPRDATAMALVAPRSVWLDVAVEQYAHLQQSESLNRKLRAAVKKQMKLGEAVQLLLRKKSVKQELVKPTPSTATSSSELPFPLKTADLYENTHVLFMRASVVSRAIELSNDTTSAFNSARTKQDAICGSSLEITTSTPIACDFQRLGEMVWKATTETCVASKFTAHSAVVDVFERKVQATFMSQFGNIYADGKAVIRKFEDANRVVITYSSKYTVSDSDLIMREHSWVIATDSFADSSESELGELSAATPTSHFQTLYRLFSEQRDPSSASGSSPFTRAPDARTKHIQEVVTKGLGDRMREHALLLQSMLLAEMELVATRKEIQFRMPTLLCPCS